MSIIVPLQAVPSQVLGIQLASQNFQVSVYQKSTGLFFDLALDTADVVVGVLAHDRVRLVRSAYLGVVGDFTFYDTQGSSDPDYTGLGDRFQLLYVEASEL